MKDLLTIEHLKHNKALTAFSGVFIVVFILLGFWQIERAGFKESLINEFIGAASLCLFLYPPLVE